MQRPRRKLCSGASFACQQCGPKVRGHTLQLRPKPRNCRTWPVQTERFAAPGGHGRSSCRRGSFRRSEGKYARSSCHTSPSSTVTVLTLEPFSRSYSSTDKLYRQSTVLLLLSFPKGICVLPLVRYSYTLWRTAINKTGEKPESSPPVDLSISTYAVVFVQYVSNARVSSCAIAGAVELSIADRCIRYTSCPSRKIATAGEVGGCPWK